MRIVDKQTFRIPVILGIALVVFSTTVYTFFTYFRENEFYSYLQSTAINRSKMIFDEGVDSKHFKSLDEDIKESAYLQKQYVIYDSVGTVLYKSSFAVPHLNESMKKTVFETKIEFKKDGRAFLYLLSQ